MKDDHFLARWSKRKHAVKRGESPPEASTPAVVEPAQSVPIPAPPPAEPSLPDVSTLTGESDFSPFMREGVDPSVKQEALKTLFHDPRFNVMDGLDVYIDDYSKPDPLPEGWLEKMNQVARLGEYREPEEAGGDQPCVEAANEPPEADATLSSRPGDAEIPSDTGAAELNPPEVPESLGKPPRSDGHMV